MQHLRQRIAQILKAAPDFSPEPIRILAEDKAALEFIVNEQTADMSWPLVVILPASKNADSSGAEGVSFSTVRLSVLIHAWPTIADDDAPSLDTLALAAEHSLHEAPVWPDETQQSNPLKAVPGAATFRFLSAEWLLVSDVEMSVRLEFECPTAVLACWKNPATNP